MSNKLTYIEARDKIWNAYFRDEIKPFDAQFCFCGTLCGNEDWTRDSIHLMEELSYTTSQFIKMEGALLKKFSPWGIKKVMTGPAGWSTPDNDITKDDGYEDAIFEGMLGALEVLKAIHRSRGEVVPEDEPLLTKRNLVTV